MYGLARLFLRSTDTANGGAAVGALALRDRLAILRRALDGIRHDLLGLALHAISFNRHAAKHLSVLCLSRSPYDLQLYSSNRAAQRAHGRPLYDRFPERYRALL